MHNTEMFLEVVLLDEDFKIGNRKLGKMPFVIDSKGYPHALINEYLLSYEVITMKRDVEKTVTPKARHIVRVYNELNKLIYSSSEFKSSTAFKNEEDSKSSFHNLWHTSSESILLMIQTNMEQRADVENTTINARLSAFCHFLFWAEEKGYCDGADSYTQVAS